MKNETPTALGRREGGRIVRSSNDVPTPNRHQSQPPEWLRISPYAQPAVLVGYLLDRAAVFDVTPGLEAMAPIYRARADLIRRGRFIQARPR